MPELPLTLTGSDATDRLRAAGLVPDPYGKAAEVARVNARMPDEACARLREWYARRSLDRTLADLDPMYSARAAEIVADLCRRLDRLHNEQTDPNGCHSHQGGR